MILVIDKKMQKATVYADMLRYMGVIARAESFSTALGEASLRYRAIIIVNPSELPDPADYVARLRKYTARTPLFAISEHPEDNPVPELFAASFSDSIYSSTLLTDISRHCVASGLSVPGTYMLAGIDASVDCACVTHFGTPIPLTRTETMILRYLTAVYPSAATAADILRFTYRDSRRPEESSVRAHICVINKKFRKIKGRNLISYQKGNGYSVLTPRDMLEETAV